MEQETQTAEAVEAVEPPTADFEEVPAAPAGPVGTAAGGGATPGNPMPLSALYDLRLPVTIELGRTRMAVQEVLELGRGSVIELDRLAGEPVDIFVGDRRFAEGEVVVLGENFGVRITRVIPPSGKTEAA